MKHQNGASESLKLAARRAHFKSNQLSARIEPEVSRPAKLLLLLMPMLSVQQLTAPALIAFNLATLLSVLITFRRGSLGGRADLAAYLLGLSRSTSLSSLPKGLTLYSGDYKQR